MQFSPISSISFLLDSNIYKATSVSRVYEHELLQWSALAEHIKFVAFWCMPNDYTYVAGCDVSNWDRLSNKEWKFSAWGESATWNQLKHIVISIICQSTTNCTCSSHTGSSNTSKNLQASGSPAAGRANHVGQYLGKLPNRGSQLLQFGGCGKGLKTVSPLKKKSHSNSSNYVSWTSPIYTASRHMAIHWFKTCQWWYQEKLATSKTLMDQGPEDQSVREAGASGRYSWATQGLKWAAVPKEKCKVPTAMNTKILLACYAVCFGE
jgi:hypothetical protein